MTKKKVTKKKTTKRKVTKTLGRPSKYRKEYCQALIDHMATGLSFETFGATIDVACSTVYKWVDDYPDFSEAKKKAEAKCRVFWERMGTGIAAGKLKNGNSGVWIYNMKCRFPKVWRPKKEVDVSARYEKDIDAIKNMSAKELAELAEAAAMFLREKEHDET